MKNVFELRPGTVKTWQLKRGASFEVSQGKVWVTIEGDLQDFILSSGQVCMVTMGAKVVAQALGERSEVVVDR